MSQRGARATTDWGSNEIRNFVIEQVAAKTAQGVEDLIWRGGSVGGAGLSDDGTFDEDGFGASSLASATTQAITAITAANVINELGLVYQK